MSIKVSAFDTSGITAFVKGLEKAVPVMKKDIRDITMNAAVGIKLGLVAGTPEDTGKMKKQWRMRNTSGGNNIFSVSIKNTASQASTVELGGVPGSAPWPSATKGRMRQKGDRKPSEKTVLSKGAIWSTQAIGGITSRVVKKSVVNKLCRDIANSLVKTLVK